jgi:hypothetical protein
MHGLADHDAHVRPHGGEAQVVFAHDDRLTGAGEGAGAGAGAGAAGAGVADTGAGELGATGAEPLDLLEAGNETATAGPPA